MATQAQVDSFNAAIASGNFGLAADIAAGAGYGAADVEAYIEANAGNLGFDPGIDIPSDVVASYFDAPPVSYGPPSPAVSPVVANPISLTPAGIASLAPSANVSSPANVFSPADYGPPSPPPAAPEPVPAAVDPVAQKYVNDFNALINQGNYEDAARLVKNAELAGYGEEAYRAAAVILDRNPNLPPELNFLNAEGIASIKNFVEQATRPPPPAPPPAAPLSFTDQLNALFQTNLGRLPTEREAAIYAKDFGGTFSPELEAAFLSRSTEEMGNRQKGITKTADAAAKTEKEAADTAAANAAGLPGVGQIAGMPKFARQEFSPLTFAPLRRGIAQLRPAAFMPGLTSGQAPLGGSGFTPEALRTANQGLSPADRAYLMDVGGVSPAELAAATGTPVGQLQAEYNQSRSRGLFSTGAPAPRGLPEDFVLQTGAYGAPTPTFFTPTPAKTTFPSGSSSANANQAGFTGNDGSGSFESNPNSPGGGFSAIGQAITDALGLTPTPVSMTEEGMQDQDSGGAGSGATGSGAASGPSGGAESGTGLRIGGLTKMAEGGGPPKMAELSAKEAGSTFDISKYIDDEGRLVGGYSKPIYDDNRVITGYDYRPYERDVVFGEELREKEAAMRLTDAEREQMMVEMAMRQGRTGIDPKVGGLAGIEIGDPMMRRRPQYYSTVEQFRPRYAEGGLANVAQNLAERGRKGDSMLVHMAPEEVAGLRALARAQGTDMTINPRTGLPEAFSLKKLFKAASFILPFVPIPGLFGMSSLLTKSILSGVAAGASAKGGFDLKQALGGGLRAYAMGSLGEKMSGAPTPGGAPAAPTTTSVPAAAAVTAPTVTVPGVDGDISLAGSYTGPGSTPLGPSAPTGVNPMAGIENIEVPLSGQPALGPSAPIDTYTLRGGPQTGEAFYNKYPSDAVTTTPGSVPEGGAVPGRTASVITPEGQGFGKPFTKGTDIAMAGLGGFSLEKAAEEQRSYEIEAAASKREDEERKRRFDELFARTLGSVRTAKAGGTINLAKGGMTYMEAGGTTGPTGTPRDVTGTGDGMSDSVPATIEGVQEARLADGEFVIPADVVADIGNGSSDAGSKKLYDMMDRIRKARHGTTKQPPEIKAERLMPA